MELEDKSSEKTEAAETAAVTTPECEAAAAPQTDAAAIPQETSAPAVQNSIPEVRLDDVKAEPVDEIKTVPLDSASAEADAAIGFDAIDTEKPAQEAAAPVKTPVKSAAPERIERPRREPRPIKPVAPEVLEESRSILAHMLDFLGIEATVRAECRPRSVNLLVSSEEPGRVIGHHGQTLDNLQLIVNRIMQKNDSEFPKLFIDMEGSRDRRPRTERPVSAERGERPERPVSAERGERPERRTFERRGDRPERRERPFERRGDRPERRSFEHRSERPDRPERSFERRGDRPERGMDDRRSFSHDEILRQQALDAAKEVRLFGLPKTLPPMNSHDRRIVHLALETESGLTTDSSGDGENRSVVIALKDETNA